MTTVIIDRVKGLVVTDSRGMTEEEHTKIVWRPLPFLKKWTEKQIFDDTQKIFKVRNHLITGSGSLELINVTVDRLKSSEHFLKDRFYHKCSYDLDCTSVFITKRTLGKVYTLKLVLSPKRVLGTKWCKISVDKFVCNTDYTASGSGSHYAIGAMDANGKDAEAAVNTAKKFDVYSGGENQVVYV